MDTVKLHLKDPETITDEEFERIVGLTRDSFPIDNDRVPSRDDIYDHVFNVSSLVFAEKDGELIGYSATAVPGDANYYPAVTNSILGYFLIQNSLAVDRDEWHHNIGNVMTDAMTLQDFSEHDFPEEEPVLIMGRTQNPWYLNYIEAREGFPRVQEQTPDTILEKVMKASEYIKLRTAYRWGDDFARSTSHSVNGGEIASKLAPDNETELEGHVLRKAYPQQLLTEEAGEKIHEYVDDMLKDDEPFSFEAGDAVIALAEVTPRELGQRYEEEKDSSDYVFDDSDLF